MHWPPAEDRHRERSHERSNTQSGRARARAHAGHDRRRRANISREADPHGRAFHAGQRQRHSRAPDRAQAQRQVGPADRGGRSSQRRRHGSGPHRRRRFARRSHADADVLGLRGQRRALHQSPIRFAEGFRGRDAGREHAAGAGGGARPRREEHQGVDRARARETRPDQLRLVRNR